MPGMQSSNILGFFLCQIQTHDQGIQNGIRSLVEFPKEFGSEVSKPWEYLLGQPYVVLNFILLATNLIALLFTC